MSTPSSTPNWQQQTAEFAQNHNLTHDPGVYFVDLLSELGEAGKAWLLATDYGQRPLPPQANADLQAELGDVLYSLCQLANAASIDLDVALAETLAKYTARFRAKGHTGSQP